ncbi:hypothetical protein MKUB_47450 [Mycobacterium kubicae]|uniref:Secreted protein n=1 Tax=Mycobacterium kubicae TaxID=120959 RepID=A0ABQ1BUT4_9MYCO|nr:hypothetical protein MKUB_47450 [Mycobacterium kubicae]
MLADTSSRPAGITAVVAVAIALLAELIDVPMPAKSVAAAATNGVSANKKDICALPATFVYRPQPDRTLERSVSKFLHFVWGF